MTAIPGVPLAGMIVPTDSLDGYPTHDPLYQIGGYRTADDITARNSIPAARRRVGMQVYIIATGAEWRLVGGILDANWVDVSPATGSGVTDGDKGVILVSGGGTVWTFDPTVVTAAAQTVLDDASTAAMLTTLGAAPLANPTFTGGVNIPNVSAGNSSTLAANTAFVQGELVGKAPLASPAFTGAPTAPTAAPGTNTTQLATTAYADAGVTALKGGAPTALDTLGELATSLGNDPAFSTTVTTALAAKLTNTVSATDRLLGRVSAGSGVVEEIVCTAAGRNLLDDISAAAQLATLAAAPLASPTFTGTPAAPTAAPGTNTTQLASTAFVGAAIASNPAVVGDGDKGVIIVTGGVWNFDSTVVSAAALTLLDDTSTAAMLTTLGAAPLASPTFTGTPAAPTATAGTNTTQIATTAYATAADTALSGTIITALALKAPLASPDFTGTPTAPTAASSTNNTQLSTTAYADAAVSVLSGTTTTALALKAPLASPTFTGTPAAPTAAPSTNNTQLSTTAYADAAVGVLSGTTTTALALKAPLASPALTGTPTAPTAAANTNTTQIASTAYADAAVGVLSGTTTTALAGKQPLDAELTALAGLTSAADQLPYFSGFGTAALASFTAAGRALIDDANVAAQQTTLALVPGTNVQAFDAKLAALAGLTGAANKLAYFTGATSLALTDFTVAGRALVDDADAAAQRATLALDTVSIGGHIETVANKTYYIDLKAARAYTVASFTYRAITSGSCTAAVQIDGTNITSLSALSVTGTEVETSATGANTVAIGQTLSLVVSANSAALDFVWTLKVSPA